jgi:hypothetical protein
MDQNALKAEPNTSISAAPVNGCCGYSNPIHLNIDIVETIRYLDGFRFLSHLSKSLTTPDKDKKFFC